MPLNYRDVDAMIKRLREVEAREEEEETTEEVEIGGLVNTTVDKPAKILTEDTHQGVEGGNLVATRRGKIQITSE